MATTNMNLSLPVVTTTLGPDWATELNAALEVVDAHDHTSGKGVPIPTSALNINADLDFNNNKPFDLKSVQFLSNLAALTGASNASSLSATNGDLYWTNGAGTAVQVTSGGSVVTTPASVQSFEVQVVNTNLSISSSDTFVFLLVDTTAARSITLPLASSVAAGRLYIVKDTSGLAETNAITVSASGSDLIDGSASLIIDSNRASAMIVGNGATSWSVS